MSEKTTVGYIGLGVMGRNMARHLQNAGYPLSIYDANPDAGAALVEAGAWRAGSIAELAERSGVVLSALPGPKEVRAVALGPGGVIESLTAGKTYIDMSTNSPTLTREIYAAGKEKAVEVLDAAMSGGMHGAVSRHLTLIVGGDKPAYEQHRELLEAMSDNVRYAGGSGTGTATKIVNNMIALSVTGLIAEALVLGVKAGVELTALTEIISTSTGATWRMNESFPRYVLRGDFEPGFAVDLAAKDLNLAHLLADEAGLKLDFLELAESLYAQAQRRGWGQQHSEAIVKLIEEPAEVELRLPE